MILLFAMTLFAQDSSQEAGGLQQFEVTPELTGLRQEPVLLSSQD